MIISKPHLGNKNQPPWESYLNPLEKQADKRVTDIYIPIY